MDNQTFLIGIAVVLFLALLAIILLVHENEKKDLQSEIDSGIIARDLIRLSNQLDTIDQLKKKIESDQNVIDKNMTRILNQGIEIEMLEMKKEENRKLINELYGKNATEDERNGLLQEEISDLKKSKDYYKAKANHEKLPAKVVESEWWECISDEYLSYDFINGGKYKEDKTAHKVDNSSVWLFAKDYALHSWLAEKKYFKPVKR